MLRRKRLKLWSKLGVFFARVSLIFKTIFSLKLFAVSYLLFWFYYFRQPFNFEETKNILIITAYFYLPVALFFNVISFFLRISRFHSVTLSFLGLLIVPVAFFFTSPALNAFIPAVKLFGYYYGLALPIGIASLLIIIGSIPAYFRLIFRKPQYFMFSVFALLFLIYVAVIEYRFSTQFNGYSKFFCSYQETKNKISPNVVRIIGSYSEGSGFFVKPNVVVTNRHVVDGEDYPKIVLPTGKFLTPIKVELSHKFDLAFLTVDGSKQDYKIDIFTDDAILSPGEEVLSFGYALGSEIKGDPTIIPIHFENIRSLPQDETNYLQFSSPLVEGMSGGPVIDKCGSVIGINAMSTSGTSLIIARNTLEDATTYPSVFNESPEKIELKPGATPKDSVYAYYYLLKARDTKGCYDLLSSNYKTKSTYEEWTARFPNVISVEVFNVEEIKPNLVYVTFGMSEWVNEEQSRKTYEGTWETIKEGDVYHLNKSYIIEFDSYLDLKGPDFFLNPDPKKK